MWEDYADNNSSVMDSVQQDDPKSMQILNSPQRLSMYPNQNEQGIVSNIDSKRSKIWQSRDWIVRQKSGTHSNDSLGADNQWNSPKGQDIVLLENEHSNLPDSATTAVEIQLESRLQRDAFILVARFMRIRRSVPMQSVLSSLDYLIHNCWFPAEGGMMENDSEQYR